MTSPIPHTFKINYLDVRKNTQSGLSNYKSAKEAGREIGEALGQDSWGSATLVRPGACSCGARRDVDEHDRRARRRETAPPATWRVR